MASISFCKECNNLLYPREDKVHHVLMYACRNCPYEEETHNPCVYKHDLIVAAKETAGVTQDLETDPTLPRSNITCPRCGHQESVFFGDQGRRAQTSMTLFYNCTNCHRTFLDPKLTQRRKEQAAQQQ
ncbi:DNA-directed RNA polymerase II subunit I [Rhodotorula sp. JG-1b]|nr:DNA-directed RNA polymerase II subunit I [Rhodotorula sp. JG-1b]